MPDPPPGFLTDESILPDNLSDTLARLTRLDLSFNAIESIPDALVAHAAATAATEFALHIDVTHNPVRATWLGWPVTCWLC